MYEIIFCLICRNNFDHKTLITSYSCLTDKGIGGFYYGREDEAALTKIEADSQSKNNGVKKQIKNKLEV